MSSQDQTLDTLTYLSVEHRVHPFHALDLDENEVADDEINSAPLGSTISVPPCLCG
jgi:hypothetical protein